jgi:uncharacterized protein (TIGR04222 family)
MYFFSHLNGPQFLLFFGFYLTSVILVCWAIKKIKLLQMFSGCKVRVVSEKNIELQDPYKIAYLRAAENGTIDTLIISLVQKGFLEQNIEEAVLSSTIAYKENADCMAKLLPIEKSFLQIFTTSLNTQQILSYSKIKLKSHFFKIQKDLQNENLLLTEEVSKELLPILIVGCTLILGLAVYRLYNSLTHGHFNVGFLLILTLVGLFILVSLCKPSRLSPLGKKHLNNLKKLIKSHDVSLAPTEHLLNNIAFSAVGILALSGSGLFAYQMFLQENKMSNMSGGGCSSTLGCSSSGCGGGGGCGGCGGD